MPDQYAVIGNPIAHSLSPRIHAEFARQTGQDLQYTALLAPLQGFREAVTRFRDAGGRGLNVTVPFKLEAFDYAEQKSARAAAAGAVNTLSFGDDVAGDNTDGAGLVRDISGNLGIPLAGRRVLVLGAGGAAAGVLGPLLAENPAALAIVNRTPQKAQALAERFAGASDSAPAEAVGYAALRGREFDVVVNATSAGLHDAMPQLPAAVFAPAALAYDMVYGRDTPFLKMARQAGVRAVDGLGMLIEQAAESFFIWRGIRPATAPVIELLRKP